MKTTPAHGGDATGPEPVGELLVLNGRNRGARRPLTAPMTLVGRSASCDVRLNADGVHPMHCAFVQSGDRLLIRDLNGEAGTTLVNGERKADAILQDGDLVVVGPFQFEVRLPLPAAPQTLLPAAASPTAEKKPEKPSQSLAALRIQAAAVAAQQAALTGQEQHLAQWQTTLEKQQAQLASHLEEKRKRLVELHGQTQAARQALQQERESYRRQVDDVSQNLTQAQRQLVDDKQQVDAQRQRLIRLHQRLRQRFDRQWSAEQQALQKQEKVLAETYRHLNEQHAELERDKAALVQTCLKFNSEVELGRRELKSEWERLQQDKGRLQDEARGWLAMLQDREKKVVQAEESCRKKQEKQQTLIDDLQQQATGLEKRLASQRDLLARQQQAIEQLEKTLADLRQRPAALPAATPVPPAEPRLYPLALPIPEAEKIENWLFLPPSRPLVTAPAPGPAELLVQQHVAELEFLAGELTDQRLLLAEHWEQALRIEDRWRQERETVVGEVVGVIRGVQQQAQVLLAREHAVDGAQQELRERQEELLRLRQHLVGTQGRLRAQEITIAAERDKALAALNARQELAEKQLGQLEELRRHWLARQDQELEALRSEQQAFLRAAQEYLTRGSERRQQTRDLQEERRVLNAQALALEQYRQKYLSKSRDKAAGERTLDRLRRRWAQNRAHAVAAARKENDELQAELTVLQAQCQELQKKLAHSQADKASLTRRQTEEEKQKALGDAEKVNLLQQLRAAEAQRDRTQLQIQELQDEVDRIARHLLAEPSPPPVLLHKPLRAAESPAAVDRAA